MALETEVKVRVDQEALEGVRARLERLGARLLMPRCREQNRFYDFPDGRLARSGSLLRLRQAGDWVALTYKGKRLDDPLFKKRQEIESRVEDAANLHRILERLGLEATFEYSKFREVFELELEGERAYLCLDETAAGTFVEIEAPAALIEPVASLFGWTREQFLRQSYAELYPQ